MNVRVYVTGIECPAGRIFIFSSVEGLVTNDEFKSRMYRSSHGKHLFLLWCAVDPRDVLRQCESLYITGYCAGFPLSAGIMSMDRDRLVAAVVRGRGCVRRYAFQPNLPASFCLTLITQLPRQGSGEVQESGSVARVTLTISLTRVPLLAV